MHNNTKSNTGTKRSTTKGHGWGSSTPPRHALGQEGGWVWACNRQVPILACLDTSDSALMSKSPPSPICDPVGVSP
jgi:hypothetical protein